MSAAGPLEAPGVHVDADALQALRHQVRAARTARPGRHSPSGGSPGRRRGRGLETFDIRVFVEGDDHRLIERNATARTGVPHVRCPQDERERSALLVADFRPSMLWGTRRALRSVAAAEALALIGWSISEAGGRVGLLAIGTYATSAVAVRGRAEGMAPVIAELAGAHRSSLLAAPSHVGPDKPLEEALRMAADLLPSGGSVYIATALDESGDGFDRAAALLRSRASVTVLLIRDAFELRPPRGHYRYRQAAGLAATAVVGHGGPGELDPRIARLERLGLAVIPLDAADPVETMALRLRDAR